MDTAHALAGSAVAARRRSVRSVAATDGSVLVDEATGVVVPLNRSAALVWECLDGESTASEIAADLADVTGETVERVLADVLAILGRLRDERLVDGLGEPSVERAPATPDLWSTASIEASFPDQTSAFVSVRLGARVVRLRANDAEMLDLLTGALDGAEGAEVVSDVEAPADISLLFTTAPGSVQTLHYLYRDSRPVFRSASRGHLLRACLAELDAFLPPPPGTVRLQARGLIAVDRAAIVGGEFLEALELAGPRLERAGWRVVDGAAVVDRDRLRLQPAARTLVPARAGLDAIEAGFPRTAERGTAGGPRAVRVIVIVGSAPEADELDSEVQRLSALARLVGGLDRPGAAEDLALVGRLASGATSCWIVGLDDEELLAALNALGRVTR